MFTYNSETGKFSGIKEGDRVRARRQVTESGGDTVGDPGARFVSREASQRTGKRYGFPQNFIHAEEGDFGTVENVDGGADNVPTVRFDRTGTATIVGTDEVEVIVEG